MYVHLTINLPLSSFISGSEIDIVHHQPLVVRNRHYHINNPERGTILHTVLYCSLELLPL